jgi:BirA family biotin operon repressor/biotin-[acetyl-CoA-carboxylase] ligase
MQPNLVFHILKQVDSTNNYAMEKIHAGMAKDGMAWFAQEQIAGKGQRGKNWYSNPGENIVMSVAIENTKVFKLDPFLFNCVISLSCSDFLERIISQKVEIKWPNDLFFNDRKAGGILIENIYRGNNWSWAVAGIGINVNQNTFPHEANRPISINQILGKKYNPELLAIELHQQIYQDVHEVTQEKLPAILERYNEKLYKKNQGVKIKFEGKIFETKILTVNSKGVLFTLDEKERAFNFGEIDWLMESP